MKETELVKLIDITRCTACRGCQIACKQWNNLPASKTRNFGSYQNPADLEWNTWTLIRFKEYAEGGQLRWLFRKDGCLHCTDAGCVKVCPTSALHHTEFGAVGLDRNACIGCKRCISACPFDIPKYDEKSNKVYKCDLCLSRLRANQPPACVLSCPTGALTMGLREEMYKKAHERARQLGGRANVYGDKFVDGTHVIYVLPVAPSEFDKLPADPKVPGSIVAWKDVLKPVGALATGGVAAAALLHYITHGPKTSAESDNQGNDGGGV